MSYIVLTFTQQQCVPTVNFQSCCATRDSMKTLHVLPIVLRDFSVSFYDDKGKSGNTSFQGSLILLQAMDTSQDAASYGTWALSLYLPWPIIYSEDFRYIHPMPL